LAKDKTDARNGHVSLSAFGISLGEPLQLPACTDETSESCVLSRDATMLQLVAQLKSAARVTLPAVPAGAPVKLPRSRCPSWIVGCIVYLDLQNGIPVGVFAQTIGTTNEDIETVEEALNEKYGKHMVRGRTGRACTNTVTGIATAEATDRSWRVPGLSVVYSPVVDCNLRMGTAAVKFRSIRAEAERRQKASEPKM
jgi:hypothetical protein